MKIEARMLFKSCGTRPFSCHMPRIKSNIRTWAPPEGKFVPTPAACWARVLNLQGLVSGFVEPWSSWKAGRPPASFAFSMFAISNCLLHEFGEIREIYFYSLDHLSWAHSSISRPPAPWTISPKPASFHHQPCSRILHHHYHLLLLVSRHLPRCYLPAAGSSSLPSFLDFRSWFPTFSPLSSYPATTTAEKEFETHVAGKVRLKRPQTSEFILWVILHHTLTFQTAYALSAVVCPAKDGRPHHVSHYQMFFCRHQTSTLIC